MLRDLNRRIIACEKCPRLRKHCSNVALRKKREFLGWDYWGKPVPGFGDAKAKLWIIGLAPAAHGANRTGRMFTGDSSGRWLYRALYRVGLANQETSESRDDGMQLSNVYISAAVRCAPPDNKPTRRELENCFPYLEEEFILLKNARLILATGQIAFQRALSLLGKHHSIPRPIPKFGHGKHYRIGDKMLVATYHPSRQNTQTGRLTETMWMKIFQELKIQLKG